MRARTVASKRPLKSIDATIIAIVNDEVVINCYLPNNDDPVEICIPRDWVPKEICHYGKPVSLKVDENGKLLVLPRVVNNSPYRPNDADEIEKWLNS